MMITREPMGTAPAFIDRDGDALPPMPPRAGDDCLAFIAHDLMAPLSALSALLHSEPPDERSQRLSRCVDQVMSMAGRLLDALRLERIDPHRFECLDLAEVVDDACHVLLPLAQARRVRLKLAIEFGTPMRGSRDELGRAVTNLVHNALKASPAGAEVLVQVRCGAQGEAEFAVQDHGPGMGPAEQAVLTCKAPSGAAASRRGPRLGLFYVAKAARAHGARVQVEAGPEGTRVMLGFTGINVS